MKALDRVLQVILVVNFVLFTLSFIPAVSGIGPEPGLFDRLWGNFRLLGWRADFVWMCVSTVLVVIVGLAPTRKHIYGKSTTIISWVWVACFLFYLRYTVHHMFG